MRFQDLNIAIKMAVILPVFIAGCLLLFALNMMEYRSSLYEGRALKTQHVVEVATGLATSYQQKAAAGEMSEEEAQVRALEAIKTLRYGDGEYFWVNDLQGKMLMHAVKPALDGKDVLGVKDKNGVALFQNMVDVVKSDGSGFVEYLWPKPGFEKPVAKVSFVQGVPSWGWVIGSGIYLDDIEAAFYDQLILLSGIGLAVIVIVGLVIWLISRAISKPLESMTHSMRELAGGDHDVAIDGQGRGDEVGHMADALGVFRDNMIKADKLAQAQAEEQQMKEAKQKELAKLIQQFEMTIISVLDGLSAADHSMHSTAIKLAGTASSTQNKAVAVSDASADASGNVQAVASAAEELSSSIHEISRQVVHAAEISTNAVNVSEETSGHMKLLVETVGKIGDVVRLINDIAEQTNLLALNATIESARAGEAGKGFAVVANEVKALANQTTKATEEISRQITEVQSVTKTAVQGIEEVIAVISQISEASSTISAAVEEQGAATQEIAANAERAATGTTTVSTAITEVEEHARESAQASADLKEASDVLSDQTASLKTQVAEFLEKVRFDDTEPTELVSWGDELVFGVAKIDNEHKRLMDLVNQVYRDVKSGKGGQVDAGTFTDLFNYSKQHFADEAQFMESINYPDMEAHRVEHATFLDRLKAMDSAAKAGQSIMPVDVVSFMGSWWQSHIAGSDAKLAAYSKKNGISMAA